MHSEVFDSLFVVGAARARGRGAAGEVGGHDGGEQRAHGRKAGADDSDVDFDCREHGSGEVVVSGIIRVRDGHEGVEADDRHDADTERYG